MVQVFDSHDLVMDAIEQATVRGFREFGEDDLLVEKQNALESHVREITYHMIDQKAEGYFWIVTSEKLAELLTCRISFVLDFNTPHLHMGGYKTVKHGILDRRWEVWVDPQLPADKLLVGHTPNRETPLVYGVITVKNFSNEKSPV
jgi:hypothetical protein